MPNANKVEILTIGNELLLGIRTNTHLTYLGKQLSLLGLNIQHCQVIPDDPKEIQSAIALALTRSTLIIVTGGLGPTEDDMTRESVANALNKELIYNDTVLESIKEYFSKIGRGVSSIHKKQCFQIEGSTIMKNERGTAPGLFVENGESVIALLPGPSHELIPMFQNQLVPLLKDKSFCAQAANYVQIRVCGIGESSVEELILPIVKKKPSVEVALCVHLGIVDLRLSCPSANLEYEELMKLAHACRELLGDHFVGFGEVSLSGVIFNILRKSDQTLAVAESCTGGLMGNAFTDISGASKVFKGGVICYANEVKVLQLSVPEEIIKQHGAVSSECAIAMASGAAENLSADYGLSITGFAGPDGGNANNPVGTIHIGFYSPFGVWAKSVRYIGGRLDVKARAVNAALDWMRRELIYQDKKHRRDCSI